MPRVKATPAGIVAELYSLLESASADGIITDDEATAIHTWLVDNRDAGIASFDLLRTLLDQFLADGKITEPERKTIHATVEKVLPSELRQKAKAARTARQLIVKTEAANAREQARLQRPIGNFNFLATGISYENRAATIDTYVSGGTLLFLAREPNNPYDANAICLRTQQGFSVGYVPRGLAIEIAPLLDGGSRQVAYCTKVLRGRRIPIPVVQATFYRHDQEIPNAVAPDAVPVFQETQLAKYSSEPVPMEEEKPDSNRVGCIWLSLAAVVGGLLWLLRNGR